MTAANLKEEADGRSKAENAAIIKSKLEALVGQIPGLLKAEVTVNVKSELSSQYRVIVLVVENKVEGWQKTTTYPEGKDDYIHNHVVRKVVTSYGTTFTGEKITDSGSISSGDEASKTWSVELDEEWNLENTEIYALALDSDGYVNNMNLCDIDGGDSGYDLK